MRVRLRVRFLVLLAVLSLVAAGCGGGSRASSTPTGGTGTAGPVRGGSAIFGAEQWSECLNLITGCASLWTWQTVLHHVLPKVMALDVAGDFVASPVLVEAPSLENGGINANPFAVTFRFKPEAVWADGSPITSEDLDFTWRAFLHTTGSYTVGYDQIESIDTSDPNIAVLHFKKLFLDWPDLFGGGGGAMLEEAAFPEFAQDPEPNLKDEMLEDIPFSGGPWILQSWSKDQAVLIRNPNYFDKVPFLDKVTFIPRPDQAVEIQSLLSGEVDAIFPQPSAASLIDQVAGTPGIKVVGGNGPFFEALWFNHDSEPLDDPVVREALMYAIDRQSVIDAIIKVNNPDAEVLNCGFLALPQLGPWCGTKPFAKFTYDPGKAKSILESGGYDCSSAPCTKDGGALTVGYTTISSNARRTTTQDLLVEKALDAGFGFDIKNYPADVFFNAILTKSRFTMADYATGLTPDPSLSWLFGCDNIPTAANEYTGGNGLHWCNRQVDELMQRSDAEIDPNRRLDLMNQIYAHEVEDFISLPLYALPTVSAWNADVLGGPIQAYTSSIYGGFYNINEWYLLNP